MMGLARGRCRIAIIVLATVLMLAVVFDLRSTILGSTHRLKGTTQASGVVTVSSVLRDGTVQPGGIVSDGSELLPELLTRGKLQKERVAHYCSSYSLDNTTFILPSDKHERYLLNRHLLFDDDSESVFCWVEKIACTEIKRMFAIHKGILPVDSVHWEWNDYVMAPKYLYPLYAKYTLANANLSVGARLHRIRSYYKMMIVRHPLDRIVSGYLSKILSKVVPQNSEFPFPMDVKREIILRHHQQQYNEWIKSQYAKPVITFPEFIQYILDTEPTQLNSHFRPMTQVCHPCRIRYDFYGNFQTLHKDGFVVVERLGGKRVYFRNKPEHNRKTSTKLKYYYSRLHHDTKKRLLKKWQSDLDFYYHLHPEDKDSHKDILEVDY